MAQILRFVDPAFRCEIVLSGALEGLYRKAQPEFDRLKGIRSLGLMAYVHDVGTHTRHQHAVGLMRIFSKLCLQTQGKGLPKQFLWSFWSRLCFGQAGHAALSYDAEKAVLLACQHDLGFAGAFRRLVEPVLGKVTPCRHCQKSSCPARDNGQTEAESWFAELVSQNRWDRVHLWIAALKMVRRTELTSILRNQQSAIGYAEPESYKIMIAPQCGWNSICRNLSQLDFIVRDLAYAGTLGIQLDVDSLVAAANAEHPDWALLDGLRMYMVNTLYETLPAQTASVLLQRPLAALLIEGELTLERLFGIDSDPALTDDDLRKLMQRKLSGREAFDPVSRNAWRAWKVGTLLEDDQPPCEIEKAITGRRKGHLAAHIRSRVMCIRLEQEQDLAVAMRYQGQGSRPEAKTFVKLCRSVLGTYYPLLAPDDLASALCGGLFNRNCEDGLGEMVHRLSELQLRTETLRRAASIVHRRASGKTESDADFGLKIGGYDYPLRGHPQELVVNTMHAALSGSESLQQKLGISGAEAAAILWGELATWQSVYFGRTPSKKITSLVDEAQSQLEKQVVASTALAQTSLEDYAFLEALKHPGQSVSFRVSLPNLTFVGGDGEPENEYDVVSVVLKGDRDVEVWVWGVTTAKGLDKKRVDDLGKIQRIKDLLGERWGSDVRVVTCYVHRDGNYICLEIDGKQSKRLVTP